MRISKYIKDFNDEFSNITFSSSSYQSLIKQALKSRIILLADYRSLPQSQSFIAEFIYDIQKNKEKLILGIDTFFTHNQKILDDYLYDELSETDLLNLTGYRKNWGYPWKNYSKIFQTAKKSRIKVFAMDSNPRNNLRYIRKRDENMAWKINELTKKFPDYKILVVSGESRFTKGHIPERLSGYKIAPSSTIMRIFQNLDVLYEKFGNNPKDYNRCGNNLFCVMNAAKEKKTESFKTIRNSWELDNEDDDRTDLEGTIYGLIDRLLKFLNIDKFGFKLESYKGISPFIVDNYPRIAFVKDNTDKEAGSMFIPGNNRLLISRFDIVHGGEEIAHYVNSALKGELYKKNEYKNIFDMFYIKIIEEGLGYFASKIFAPEREFRSIANFQKWDKNLLKHKIDQFNYKQEELVYASEFIKGHHEFEKIFKNLNHVPKIIMESITKENKMTPLFFHDLGYRLGEILYKSYKDKKITKKHVINLFKEKFSQTGKSLETYIELVSL